MNLKVSFSWVGLVVFALPMLINIAYVMFPPAGEAKPPAPVTHWVEIVEQVSRIAYLLAVTLLVSRRPVSWRSAWLFLAAVFLILYYAVWIRYFALGREITLLKRVSLCPHAARSIPRLILSLRRRLAAQRSGGDPDGYFRRGALDSIDSIVSIERKALWEKQP